MSVVLSVFYTDILELMLRQIRRVDIEREDVAGMRGARHPPKVGQGIDALPVDLQEHGAAFDAAGERRSPLFDARDEDPPGRLGDLQALGGLSIQFADAESEYRVLIGPHPVG